MKSDRDTIFTRRGAGIGVLVVVLATAAVTVVSAGIAAIVLLVS